MPAKAPTKTRRPPSNESERGREDERTVMIEAPRPRVATPSAPTNPAALPSPPMAPAPPPLPSQKKREPKPYFFRGLEKLTRVEQQLAAQVEWMLPGAATSGEVGKSVAARLKELIEESVFVQMKYLLVITPASLRRYISDPTFLAVLAPQPNKTRGFLEIEIGLAHAIIDRLLGGAGEAIALRPLTDIEEGVMTYVLLEMLKALTPNLDPELPRLRIEAVCKSYDEAVAMVQSEAHLAVVQFEVQLGAIAGFVRLILPESVLVNASPSADAAVRQARRAANAAQNVGRVRHLKTELRAQIGSMEISSADLTQLRERDVLLVEQLTARPDKGEGGTAQLRLGAGRSGHFEAEIQIENGSYRATLTGFVAEEPSYEEPADVQSPDSEEQEQGAEGADLLNDIPLQVTVELGRVALTAEDVVGLKVGQVLELNRAPGEPVDLSVNGRVIGRGELVEVDGNLGVRVLALTGA